MSDVLNIALTSQNGITLNTEGTYCDKNIQIIPQLEDKTVTPTEESQTITAGENYAGIGTVIVEAIPTEYVVPSGEVPITSNGTHDVSGKASAVVDVQPALTTKEITLNGTYLASDDSVDGYSSVTVNVATSEVEEVTSEEQTVIPTTSVQEITPISADYLSKVTIEAIPSEYVIPSGSVSITENGTHDVSGKAEAVVEVPQTVSPTPIEVATEEEMTSLLATSQVGTIYKYTGESGTYENGALYIVEEGE